MAFFRCFYKAKSVDEIEWSLCKCNPKFPKDELPFYAEQKFTRKGTISTNLDLKGSQKLQKIEAKNLKKQNEPQRQLKQKEREAPRFRLADPQQASALIPEPEPLEFEDNMRDADFLVPDIKPKVRNTNSYNNFVSYGKRNGIPSRVLAGLMNCLRIDDGETDPSKFCSTKKIDNEWARLTTKQTREHMGISGITGLIFDGKKGPSKVAHSKEIVMEKITCIMEPPGTYLDHFEPEDSTAYTIACGLFRTVIKYDSVQSLLLIGGDNCPTNSGTPLPNFKKTLFIAFSAVSRPFECFKMFFFSILYRSCWWSLPLFRVFYGQKFEQSILLASFWRIAHEDFERQICGRNKRS